MTREDWLQRASMALADKACMREADLPRVSVGFPSTRATATRNRALGQCWSTESTADARAQVFVSPVLADDVAVLAVLLHELGHVKHPGCGHRGPFKRFMRLVGLEGKATATVPGAQCAAWLGKVAADLGPYPHAELKPGTGRKKQGTRLLKVQCRQCEAIARVTAQWAGSDGETAPFCGYCGIEGNADTMVRMELVQ
jgi:hypothetical protein